MRNLAMDCRGTIALLCALVGCAEVDLEEVGSHAPSPHELALQAGSEAAPPPEEVAIGTVSYDGFGCKKNTLPTLNEKRTVLSIFFSDFAVRATPVQSFALTGCRMTMPLKVPDGWSVAVTRYVYEFVAQLPTGTSGYMDVEYGYDEPGATTVQKHIALKPSSTTLGQFVVVDVASPEFSACGKDRSVVTGIDLGVSNLSELGEVATVRMLAATGHVGSAVASAIEKGGPEPVSVRLEWKRCK